MKAKNKVQQTRGIGERTFKERFIRDIKMNGSLYLIFVPILIWYILFRYKPMYGLLMSFQNFSPRKGVMGSEWVGLQWFSMFLNNPEFWRLIKNTVRISLSALIWGFPFPIMLALLLNEIRIKWFKSTIQTAGYLPHFISMMVVCGLLKSFTSDQGLINDIIAMFAGDSARVSMLNKPEYFVPVYVISGIWQGTGWASIVYYASLTGIDQQLYEAAQIDGANKLKQVWHITIPGILPTIVTLTIINVGSVLNVGYEKIFLLYNPATYETADVVSTYVYRQGLEAGNYGYSTAVGFFNAVISFTLVRLSDLLSKKLGQSGLF